MDMPETVHPWPRALDGVKELDRADVLAAGYPAPVADAAGRAVCYNDIDVRGDVKVA